MLNLQKEATIWYIFVYNALIQKYLLYCQNIWKHMYYENLIFWPWLTSVVPIKYLVLRRRLATYWQNISTNISQRHT